MNKFLEVVKVVFMALAVFCIAGFSFYACEIVPMEECQEHHSFSYCYKLLHRN